jgi:hypothetical protein
VCSEADLRKIHFCHFFLSFLSFQCEASGQPFFAFGWVRLRRPDGCVTCPDAHRSDGRTARLHVQTRTTCPLVSEVVCVQMGLMSRLDGDPTTSIKAPGRRIFILPHTKSLFWLLVSDFSRDFAFFRPLVSFYALISHSRFFSSLFLFSFFLTIRKLSIFGMLLRL